MAINVLPGAPPVPPRQDPRTASITSPHQGDHNDALRTAIMAAQQAAELADDDQDIQQIHKAIVLLQGVLASNAKDADQALGISPALRHVRRVSRGSGY